jgi:hypothetical protein
MSPIETAPATHRITHSTLGDTDMNWKNLSIASLFAVLSLGAVAANAQDTVKSHTYMYGDHLDIAKAVSVNEASSTSCGVVQARLTYLDSAGKTQALDYRTIAQGCGQDN